MKKIFILILSIVLVGTAKLAYPQAGSITIGLLATECDQIIITWNSTYSFVGAGKNQWVQSTVTLSWPQALGANVMGVGNTTNLTAIASGFTGWQFNGAAVLVGSEYRRELILLSGGYYQDIPVGITEIVAIKLDGSGTGSFNLYNAANTNISSFNFAGEMWSTVLNPSSVSGVPLADAIRWNGTRWCGGRSTTYFGEPGTGDQGVACTVTGGPGVLHTVDAKVLTLGITSPGTLTIAPLASLTTYGAVTLNSVNGLNVDANATGTGSLITRNNTLTYSGSASSYAKQYLVDNNSYPFHIHLVGPLAYDQSFFTTNGYKGVYLSAFNLANNFTYAYTYDNTIPDWVNVSDLTYQVPSALGLALSTTTNTDYFLTMNGRFVNGSYNTGAANGSPAVNPGLNCIANPYPSGLSANTFLETNYSSNLDAGADIWAWEGSNDDGGGNYSNYNYDAGEGTGGLASGIIRMGQGFFVELVEGGSFGYFNFALSQRVHSNAILLKDGQANMLRLFTSGNNFKDESLVLFKTNGAPEYGFGDSEKWPSMYETATEAWTVSTDGKNLAINTLAPLGTQMVTVPMSFKCGTAGEYTIEAENTTSFDPGTEIYLEDLLLGGEWYDLLANPVYTFNGSPEDLQARFLLHFFGPTAIDDPNDGITTQKDVKIYGWQQDAYIMNRGSETMDEYIAYDMMGRELHRGTLSNSTINKVKIDDVTGYYIIKVITKEGGVYTGKVYITK